MRHHIFFTAILPLFLAAAVHAQVESSDVTLTLQADEFAPGAGLQVTVGVNVAATNLTALGIEMILPSGWTFGELVQGSGELPQFSSSNTLTACDPATPEGEQCVLVEMGWITIPQATAFSFVCQVIPPAEGGNGQILTARAVFREEGNEQFFSPTANLELQDETLRVENSALGVSIAPEGFVPGEATMVEVGLSYAGTPLSFLELDVTLPTGWAFLSAQPESGSAPTTMPAANATGTVTFGWSNIPAEFPYILVVELLAPAEGPEEETFTALARFNNTEGRFTTPPTSGIASLAKQGCGGCSCGWGVSSARGDVLLMLVSLVLLLGACRRPATKVLR